MTSTKIRRFSPFSLDAINFLLADVRGALGPYLNVFLVTQQHWSQTEVGLVTTTGGLLGLAVQTPIGAAIDETRAKRGAIVLALAVLGIGATVIFTWPSFWPVLIANSLMAIVGDFFGPAVAALTLGLYARTWGGTRPSDHAGFWLIGVQLLDGIGAGIFGALGGGTDRLHPWDVRNCRTGDDIAAVLSPLLADFVVKVFLHWRLLYTNFRVNMWGTSSPEDKFAGDLGNVIGATSIGGRRSDFFLQQENWRQAIWDFCNNICTRLKCSSALPYDRYQANCRLSHQHFARPGGHT